VALVVVGIVTSVAELVMLVRNGATVVVWVISLAAMLLGAVMVWDRWREEVDVFVAVGVAIGLVGAGTFGYAVNDAVGTDRSNDTELTSSAGASGGGTTTSSSTTTTEEEPSTTTTEPEGSSSTSTSDGTEPESTTSSTRRSTQGAVALSSLEPVGGGSLFIESATVGGDDYQTALRLGGCNRDELQFNVDGDFTRFTAQIGIDDTVSAPDLSFTFSVTTYSVDAGDETAFTRPMSYGRLEPVDVSIEGAQRMTLAVDTPSSVCEGDVPVWVDPQLHR